MKKNSKIAVDFDGTLAKTSCFICELINFKTGHNHTYKDINKWNYWQEVGLEKEFWAAYDFMDKKGRLSLEPYDEYTIPCLREMSSQKGDSVDIVTANNQSAKSHIEDWIKYKGVYKASPLNLNVVCLGRVSCKEKLELDYDIYIDDNPNMAQEISNFPKKFLFLANAPWNKDIKNTENVKRFESWKFIYKLLLLQNSVFV